MQIKTSLNEVLGACPGRLGVGVSCFFLHWGGISYFDNTYLCNKNKNKMDRQITDRRWAPVWGAVCGDVIGSAYEGMPMHDFGFAMFTRFTRFTDDTVCTVAVADALVHGRTFGEALQDWCRRYPRAGYGWLFRRWMMNDDPAPYNSFGNGSAMRVSACGALAKTADEALALAKQSAEVTHNHPEGIKGAQAVALAIYLALNGSSKQQIKEAVERECGYDLSRSYEEVQAGYKFDSTCQGSVPEAIIAFLASDDYESAVRLAVTLGGDADTQAAIAGSIAAAYYGVIPEHILEEVARRLPEDILGFLNELPKN